jgi:hypothetical protein
LFAVPLNVELFIVAVTEEFPTVKIAVVEFEVSVAPNEVALIALICTLPVTFANPVIVVLPAARVVIPDAAPANVRDVIDKAEFT